MGKNKILIFTILLSLTMIYIVSNMYNINHKQMESKDEYKNKQVINSMDKEIVTTKDLTQKNNQEIVSAQSLNYTEVPLNAVTKDYILKNVDKRYTKSDKLETANIMVVKQTIADASKLNGLSTIDEIMKNDNYGDIIYAILPSYVSVYNLSDDSDYLVAYVNTMQEDKNSEIIDYIFAKNNNDGEVLNNCIFDKKTGIAYIPKELYLNEKNENIISNVQIQLLQKENIKNMDKATTIVTASTTNNNKTSIGSKPIDIFDFNTTIQTKKNLNKDNILVSINGIPINNNEYSYEKETGILYLNQSAATIQSIDIQISNKNIVKNIKKQFKPLIVNAAVNSAVKMKSKGTMTITDSVKIGSKWQQKESVAYGETEGYFGSYGIGVKGAMDQQALADIVWNGGSLDYSKINQQSDFINLRINKFDGNNEIKVETPVTLYMECGHISNPLKVDYSTSTSGDWASKKMDCVIRVLDIEKDGTQPYIVIGILTPSVFTQAGVGLYRFELKSDNTIISYKNTINHVMLGFENNEVNDGISKNGYLLDTTTFVENKDAEITFSSDLKIGVPKGFYLSTEFYCNTNNEYYTMPYTIKQSNDMIVEYQYKPKNYTITYDLDDGINDSSNPTTYNILYGITLKNPIKTGYTFAGWYDENNNKITGINENKNATFSSLADMYTELNNRTAENIILKAVWIENEYIIDYNGNGATSGNMNSTKCQLNIEKELEKNQYSKTGYTFKEWNTKADGSGNSYQDQQLVKNLTSTNGKTVTLYAQWKPNTYNIKYDGNNATNGSITNSSHTYDKESKLNKNQYSKTGYTFKEWNTKADGSGNSYQDQQLIKNLTSTNGETVTLYAQWKANTYNIKYDGNNATNGSMTNSSHTYNKESKLNKNQYTKTGYTFKEWNTKADGSGNSYQNQQLIKNLTSTNGETVTLYAQWKANTYNIKYDGNGGKGSIPIQNAIYNENIKLSKSTFTKDEHIFNGWSLTKNGSIKYKDEETVKNLTSTNGTTVTLYAVWKELPKSHATSIAILKEDGLKLIEKNMLEDFIKNEINFYIDSNDENITLQEYKIINVDEITSIINTTIDKSEIELKFEIIYSTGDKSYKTAEPCILTILNNIYGDNSINYTRYIQDNKTLKTNSIWKKDYKKNTLLSEALNHTDILNNEDFIIFK